MMKIKKRILSIILALSMCLGLVPSLEILSFAAENATEEVTLKQGCVYSVPLTLSSGSGAKWIDNVAMVSVNDDGTYRVTLQIENIDKIDILQILRQGSVSEDCAATDIVLGTFNAPDTYISSPASDRETYPEDEYPADEATIYLIENGYMSDTWNDKYLQADEIEIGYGENGECYCSFDVESLEKGIYICSFRSYARLFASQKYSSCLSRGKFVFDLTGVTEILNINETNYQTAGGDFCRVTTYYGTFDAYSAYNESVLNDALEMTSVAVEDGVLYATFQLESPDWDVRMLTSILDLGEVATYPIDYNYYSYTYMYQTNSATSTISLGVYTDNLVQDGSFTIAFSTPEELVFGKKIVIYIDGHAYYYAELRLNTAEKETIEIADGDIVLTTDTYTVPASIAFSSNRMSVDMDSSSRYYTLYSMVASQAANIVIYEPELSVDGQAYTPSRTVTLQIKIPDGWDEDKVKLFRVKGTSYAQDVSEFVDGSLYSIEDGVCVLNTVYVDETYILFEEAEVIDVSALSDGIYKVSTVLWQKDYPTSLSMADAAISSDYAYLVISDEGTKRRLYLELQGIQIGTSLGYTSRIYVANNEQTEEDSSPVLNEWEELEYYSYYTAEDGSFIVDGYNLEFGLYYPQIVGFDLPASMDSDAGVYLKFVVPIMDELSNKVPGSGDGARVAKLVLTSATQVIDFDEPEHDITVLQVAVEEAANYDEADYTAASYAMLAQAVDAAEEALADDTTLTDERIVALSEAIADAIDGLTEPDERAGVYAVETTLEYLGGTGASPYQSLIQEARLLLTEDGEFTVYLYTNDITAMSLYSNGLISVDGESLATGGITRYCYSTTEAEMAEGKIVVLTIDGIMYFQYIYIDFDNAVQMDADKTQLQSVLNTAAALKETAYTSDTWAVLESAVEAAELVLGDPVAYQAEIDAETQTVQAALDNLESRAGVYSVEVTIKDLLGNDYDTFQNCVQDARLLIDEEGNSTIYLYLTDAVAVQYMDGSGISYAETETTTASGVTRFSFLILDDMSGGQIITMNVDGITYYMRMYLDLDNAVKKAVDKSSLAEAIAQAETLTESTYTAGSWANLEETLEEAIAVYADPVAYPTEISAQSSALTSAINNLVISLETGAYDVSAIIRDLLGNDYTTFQACVQETRLTANEDGSMTVYLYTKNVDAISYQSDSGFDDAEGEAVSGDGVIRYVIEISEYTNNGKIITMLCDGITYYMKLYLNLETVALLETDATALETALNMAETLIESDYTTESWEALVQAYADAQSALTNPVVHQSELDEQTTAVQTALDGLVLAPEVVARNILMQKLADIRTIYDAEDYTEESYAVLAAALAEAEAVLADENATAEEMNAQADALEEAASQLVLLSGTADKTELRGYLADALTKTNDDGRYTETSWNSFQAAIASAQLVVSNANATEQEIALQTALLVASYEALVPTTRYSTLFEEYSYIFAGTYSVPVTMLNATSDEESMGNASMVQTGVVNVAEDGTVTLELTFQSMTFAGMQGNLYSLKKVDMDTVIYNAYNYPVSYDAELATILAYYEDYYDIFNDVDSDYYDANTEGNLYPKTISIPIELNENNFYIEVYVPVMESIGTGQGTKVARLVIDWASIEQLTGVDKDTSVLEALLAQTAALDNTDVAEEIWNALLLSADTAREVLEEMNASQADIDLQVTALQAAVDAVSYVAPDLESLAELLDEAQALLAQNSVAYTADSTRILENAVANAQIVYEDSTSTYAQVQAQITALQNAITGLVKVDKDVLTALIAQAQEILADGSLYTDKSLETLEEAMNTAQAVYDNGAATETEVSAAESALRTAISGLVEKEVIDKTVLLSVIEEATLYLSQTEVYTEASLAALSEAVSIAQQVYDSSSVSQNQVNNQVSSLSTAIASLVENGGSELESTALADGVYSLTGYMYKTDRMTYSMSNNAIVHTIKLTVEDGQYYITMNFNGLSIGSSLGYLSELKYFLSGYTTNSYGVPQGEVAAVTVDSYQVDAEGNLVSDSYGTDYPDLVTFPLIDEAIVDGWVPLQVYVPIMEAIASGTGTQPVYLYLDWSTLVATTDDDASFDDGSINGSADDSTVDSEEDSADIAGTTDETDSSDNSGTEDGSDSTASDGSVLEGGSTLTGGSTLNTGTSLSSLTGSSLDSSSLDSSSLDSSSLESSSLSSGSSTKTADGKSLLAWLGLLLCGGFAAAMTLAQRKRNQA